METLASPSPQIDRPITPYTLRQAITLLRGSASGIVSLPSVSLSADPEHALEAIRRLPDNQRARAISEITSRLSEGAIIVFSSQDERMSEKASRFVTRLVDASVASLPEDIAQVLERESQHVRDRYIELFDAVQEIESDPHPSPVKLRAIHVLKTRAEHSVFSALQGLQGEERDDLLKRIGEENVAHLPPPGPYRSREVNGDGIVWPGAVWGKISCILRSGTLPNSIGRKRPAPQSSSPAVPSP